MYNRNLCCVLQAIEVHKKLNCGTAVLTESLKQLEDIESYKDGLLYGIPISIKDNVDYEVLTEGTLSNTTWKWTLACLRFGFVSLVQWIG